MHSRYCIRMCMLQFVVDILVMASEPDVHQISGWPEQYCWTCPDDGWGKLLTIPQEVAVQGDLQPYIQAV